MGTGAPYDSQPWGSWSRRSRTVGSPSLRSDLASAAVVRGSRVTGESRRKGTASRGGRGLSERCPQMAAAREGRRSEPMPIYSRPHCLLPVDHPADRAQVACAAMDERPPETALLEVVETVHGVEVKDPYRWLENGGDPAVQTWVAEQNTHTRSVLDGLAGRDALAERIQQAM